MTTHQRTTRYVAGMELHNLDPATRNIGVERQRPRCPCALQASGRRCQRFFIIISIPMMGGATASLPFYPAYIRPPRPAPLPSRRIWV